MKNYIFDQDNRFIIENYATKRPFTGFLPGLAGQSSIPLWTFYVNRGQAIAGFGVANKDNPIMAFEAANKSYQLISWTGLRTFIKILGLDDNDTPLYEPFSAGSTNPTTRMVIGMNELELQEISRRHSLQTTVLYFTLPGKMYAGLVRQITLTNLGTTPIALEFLDGLPRVLALVSRSERLKPLLRKPFTPGSLLKTIIDAELGLTVSPEAFVTAVLTNAQQHFQADFGERYWIDHWMYNLDLIETWLAVYPDQKAALFFETADIPYFDSPAVFQPQSNKYILVGDTVRQYNAIIEDEEKAGLIAARADSPNHVRSQHGQGAIFYTTVFGKLFLLALIKFAGLDPLGMDIEAELPRVRGMRGVKCFNYVTPI